MMRIKLALYSYSTAHFKLDDTRVQQLHGSTRFQKRTQHFPRAHDRPTYDVLPLEITRVHARHVRFVGVCSLNCTRASTRRSFCWRV